MEEQQPLKAPESDSKRPYQSKSLWLGLIMSVAPFIPWVNSHMNEQVAMSVLGVVVMVLRLLTKKEISLKD